MENVIDYYMKLCNLSKLKKSGGLAPLEFLVIVTLVKVSSVLAIYPSYKEIMNKRK
jgi:hypothetical protein